jgi:hypothetical protein
MTVESIYVPVSNRGNGGTVAFAFPYQFFAPSDLIVRLFDLSTNTPVPPPMLNGAASFDYGVTGTIDDDGTGEYLNGTVTFNTAPPANYRITIERSVAALQSVSLADDSLFPAKSVEAELDRLQMQIQQGQASAVRAITAPVSDGPVNLVLPPAAVRADTVLTFDDSGNVANPGISSGAIEAAIAAILAGISPAPTMTAWAKTLAAAIVLYAAPVVLADGQAMVVAGRNTVTDGYGGTFTYKAGDAATVFPQSGTGFVDASGRRWFRQFDGTVSLKWFGAKGDGATDDSVAAQAAFDSAYSIFIPKGTYLVNVTANQRVKVFGIGSTSSILKPFNAVTACVTLTNTTADWSMSYLFEALGFSGTARAGIGVALAKTDPTLYALNDEYVGRVSFNNCFFSSLEKGIQRTFGNIGLYLNRTSFTDCTYGTYNLNSKFGGSPMHAGNFYCLGGETSGCDCGHYFHNGGTGGLGAIEFDGHIFETCKIALYGYTDTPGMQAAFALRSYWNEQNGVASPGAPATVNIDFWTGTTKTTAAANTHAFIFDGRGCHASFSEGGLFSDVYLRGLDSTVVSRNDHFESQSGYGGLPCQVANPANSRILISDFSCNEGGAQQAGVMTDGICTQAIPGLGPNGATGRANIIPPRILISDLNNIAGVNNACNVTAGGAADMSGGFLTTAAAVGQGSLYPDAARYTGFLTNAQFARLAGSDLTAGVGWWAWSCDVKVNAANPHFKLFDLGSNVLGDFSPPPDYGEWHSWGGIGVITSGSAVIGFWVVGSSAAAVAQDFCLRNYQIKQFESRFEAQDFLRSRVYAI